MKLGHYTAVHLSFTHIHTKSPISRHRKSTVLGRTCKLEFDILKLPALDTLFIEQTVSMLFCQGYLESFGGHCSSGLHHSISNAQPVRVLKEWCYEGDIFGATPGLQ